MNHEIHEIHETHETSRGVHATAQRCEGAKRLRVSLLVFSCLSWFFLLPGCIEHRVKSEPVEVKPIRVEPIHITVDVNVRVQERLDRFFAFEEEVEQEVLPAPEAQPH